MYRGRPRGWYRQFMPELKKLIADDINYVENGYLRPTATAAVRIVKEAGEDSVSVRWVLTSGYEISSRHMTKTEALVVVGDTRIGWQSKP